MHQTGKTTQRHFPQIKKKKKHRKASTVLEKMNFENMKLWTNETPRRLRAAMIKKNNLLTGKVTRYNDLSRYRVHIKQHASNSVLFSFAIPANRI